jgi:predicted dehydrogenase
VDLLRFLIGHSVVSANATSFGVQTGDQSPDDKSTFTLRFKDGSFGTVHYLANGHRSFPKERVEVFSSGRILQLNNFRTLRGWGWPSFRKSGLWRQDKGNRACVLAFVNALRNCDSSPIPFEQLIEVTRVTAEIGSIRTTE